MLRKVTILLYLLRCPHTTKRALNMVLATEYTFYLDKGKDCICVVDILLYMLEILVNLTLNDLFTSNQTTQNNHTTLLQDFKHLKTSKKQQGTHLDIWHIMPKNMPKK